jgi:hypothetical protein
MLTTLRLLSWFAVPLHALLLAACGGGEGDAEGQRPPPGQTSGASASPSAPAGRAIDGPLVFVSGLGLFAVDRESGRGTRIDVPGVDGIAIEPPPAVADGAAFVVTYKRLEGQSFSHSVRIARIDLATGEVRELAEVGVDRERDDSSGLTEYRELVAAAGDAWLVSNAFGSSTRTITRFDGTTGERKAAVEAEGGRGWVTDGQRLFVFSNAGLQALDPATGELSTLLASGTRLREATVTGLDLAPLFKTRSGNALSSEDIEFVTGSAARLDGSTVRGGGVPLAAGHGEVWMAWSTFGIQTRSGENVLGQGLLRFDLASERITAVVPLVGFGEHFLEGNSVSSSVGDLAFQGHVLWATSPQSNGTVLRVDPQLLTATVVYEPCAGDFICNDADDVLFIRTDDQAVWLRFTRLVDMGGGSRSGKVFLAGLDPASGRLLVEAPFEEIVR